MNNYPESTVPPENAAPPVFTQENKDPGRSNVFMILSLVMGIMAFLFSSIIFAAIAAGGLSILFAILSKGNDLRMQTLPKIGILTSVVGICFSIFITAAMFFIVFRNEESREQFMTMYNEMYEEMYGESFEDALKEAYPYMQEE